MMSFPSIENQEFAHSNQEIDKTMTMSDMELEVRRIHEKLKLCYILTVCHRESQQQPILDFPYAVFMDTTDLVKEANVELDDSLEGYRENIAGWLEGYMNKGFQKYRLSRISRRKKRQFRSQASAEDHEKSQAERDQHAG